MKPRLLWLNAALSSIWIAVILISVFAPDSASGYKEWRETFPIAAVTTWFFGVIATSALIKDIGKRRVSKHVYMGVTIITIIIWLAAIPVSIFTPTLESGTDPSIFPLAAIIAPLVATVVTGLSGTLMRLVTEIDWSDDED